MIDSDLYSFFSNKSVLVLDSDKKIKTCNNAFLEMFSLEQISLGVRFDAFFDIDGGEICNSQSVYQQFRCIWRDTGQQAAGLLMGGNDGYMLIFEEFDCLQEENINDHKFSMLINNMTEGAALHRLIVKDGIPIDYIIEDINTSGASILGVQRKDVVGKRASELYLKNYSFLNEIADVVMSGTPRQVERYMPEFRKHFWFSITPWGENRFGIIFSDLTQMMHMQMLQNTLNAAANQMTGAFEKADIFDAVARVLEADGFSCMLLLTGSDLSVQKTYLSFANAPRIYRDASCYVLSGAFLQAARQKSAIYVGDFGLSYDALKELGLNAQLKGIAAPLVVSGTIIGVFVIISDGLKLREVSVVKVFVDLMAAMMERTALIQSLKRNISQLTLSKQAHEQTAQRLNMVTNVSNIGFWNYDIEQKVIYIDEATRQILNAKETEFSVFDEKWRAFVHSEDRDIVVNAFKNSNGLNEKCMVEFRIVRADRVIRYIRCVGISQKDEFGQQVRMVGSIWDITERKRTEEALEASERQLSKIFDLLPVGLWVVDKDGDIVKTNPAGEQIWEGKFERADDAKNIYKYPSGDSLKPEKWALSKTLSHSVTINDEMLEIETLKGNKKIIVNSAAPVLDENGRVQAAIMVNQDITESESAKAALKAEKELLSITLRSIGEGVVVTDKKGRVTTVNTVFEQLFGCIQHEMQGLLFDDVVKMVCNGEHSCVSLIGNTLKTGKTVSCSSGVELICGGQSVPIAYTVSAIRDGNDQIIGSVIVMRDITEQEQKQKRIDYLVYHDALTNVYNRRYFNQVVRKIDTEHNLPISVINCDVNGLKLANDAFGHNAGDQLLVKMASVLVKVSRPGDIVVRSGGDEFMILMPKADEKQAAKVCEEIKELSSKINLYSIDCSLSVGHDTKKLPAESMKAIINKAEAYMYRNKSLESPRLRFSSINSILMTLHKKCERERLHCSIVSKISTDIAREMGFSEREIAEIGLLGSMHDIGMIAINQAIFSKPNKLTEEEWVDMRRHPEVGYRILAASTDMAHIAKSVLAHHEYFDGSGYPNGIRGSHIPLTARIISVADAYEAMTHERPYRDTKSNNQALDEIASLSEKQFDPAVVDVLLKLYKQR